MVNKKVLGILVIALFVAASVPAASAEIPGLDQLFANEGSVIDLADIYMYVAPNGLLHMNETYYFIAQADNNVFTRDIPIGEHQTVENLVVTCSNDTFIDSEVTGTGSNKHVKVTVYADKNKKSAPAIGTPVAITINYDYLYLTQLYRDTGIIDVSFSWDKQVNKVYLHPMYNNTNNVKYWVQPNYIGHSDSWNNTILNIIAGQVPKGDHIEFVSTIPLNHFNGDPIYAYKVDAVGVDTLERNQQAFINTLNLENFLFIAFPILFVISLVLPVLTYIRHGREPKVKYDKEYESDLPSDAIPMFVNAMFSRGRKIGVARRQGFEASVVYLLNKGYLQLVEGKNKVIKINPIADLKEIRPFEADIITMFSRYEENGVIDLTKVKEALKDAKEARDFKIKYNRILNNHRNTYVRPRVEQMFSFKGDLRFKIYAVIILAISIFLLYFSFYSFLPFALLAKITAMVFIVFCFVLILLPDHYGGHWTEKGRLEYLKWQGFRKFYKKAENVKKHMPSLEKWNDMIVYGLALGDGDKVLKVMEEVDPTSYNESNVVGFFANGGYNELRGILREAQSSKFSGFNKNN